MDKILLPLEIYNEHLKKINDVAFTYREVDVMSSLLNMEGNYLPAFLSIQPRGIEAHTRNIRQKAGGLPDQKSIISFIKKSEKFSLIKNEYFFNLKIRIFFEKKLENLSKSLSTNMCTCLFICEENFPDNDYLILSLKEHLKLAGIKLKKEINGEKDKSFSGLGKKSKRQNKEFIIYAVPYDATDISQQSEQIIKNSNAIVLFFGNAEKIKSTHQLEYENYIELYNQENYYLSFFKILEKFSPTADLNNLISDFKIYSKEVLETSENLKVESHLNIKWLKTEKFKKILEKRFSSLLIRLKKQKIRLLMGIGMLYFCLLGSLFWIFSTINPLQNTNFETIQSDLLIPVHTTFLDRPKLLVDIESKLLGKEGIRTVSFIGCGGAGKTTLARQYARQQNVPLIWEVNAETKESLMASLEALAYAASKTQEEKRELREIQEVKNPSEREGQLLIFLKRRLKAQSNWLLIYDNVELLTDIQPYFPHDPKNWGNGRVIITTQNTNIKRNSYVENMKVVNIGELNEAEKISLFNKILTLDEDPVSPLLQDSLQKKNFLKEIPPFPLDISTAAYFLKDMQIPYDQYLNHINAQTEDFDETQQSILKDVGKYKKTRYAIISLSLKQIMNINKEFKDVLVLISLLDSQNIPKDLLYSYKGKYTVESFVQELKKRSLILENNSDIPTFSIHRSVQKIFLSYLIKNYKLQKGSLLIQSIINEFEQYCSSVIEKEDVPRSKLLENHCLQLLNHKNLLTNDMKGTIKAILGRIYFYSDKHVHAEKFLEESLIDLKDYYGDNHIQLARPLVYLGSIYRTSGKREKAKDFLEKSISIYNKYTPKDYLGFSWALAQLGNAHKEFGEYKKARDLLKKSIEMQRLPGNTDNVKLAWIFTYLADVFRILGEYEEGKYYSEESLRIFRKIYGDDHVRTAWALSYLGYIHGILGNYKKALSLIEESLNILSKHFSTDHISFISGYADIGMIYSYLGYYEKSKSFFEKVLKIMSKYYGEDEFRKAYPLVFLANSYISLGNYSLAKSILEKNLTIHKQYFGDTHLKVSWVSSYLGNAYKKLGEHEKAKDALKKSLFTYERHYGESHIETARILRDLGEVYLLEGNILTAEKLINEAYLIFQKSKHIDIYTILEILAELSLKHSALFANEQNIQQAQASKVQALNYLNQALEVVRAHFSEDSPHTQRIQTKIKTISE
jgi:hypothetical protein